MTATTHRMLAALVVTIPLLAAAANQEVHYFTVPAGSHPHDVAASPEPDGPVYFTAQHSGKLGILDPRTGKVDMVALGPHAAPHGVIMGPDHMVWITDGGQNAIVRFDPSNRALTNWPLPADATDANLNTLTFDNEGRLWFTGQSGYYGRLIPSNGAMDTWPAPRGPGAYGITTTPSGEVYYASLAGNHIARIDTTSGKATVIDPPSPKQGARRIWRDRSGGLWVSYWNSGMVGHYLPSNASWQEIHLPGIAHVYAVWVDEHDKVWLTDWSTNAIVRFDPGTGQFASFPSDREQANVRQLGGRPREVWGAESGTDRLVRIRHDD